MLLRKGVQSQYVRRVQQQLADLGYEPGPVDGLFGPRTESAVTAFQTEKGLSVDGVVGRQTWKALFGEDMPDPQPTLEQPPFYSQCFDVFGDFRVAGWREQNLARCDLSDFKDELQHLYYGWLTPEDKAFEHANWFGFLCHRLTVPHFHAAFKKIVEGGLARQLKTFDGCFNPRWIRGGDSWSTHSWAIAIDLNAPWNHYGQRNFEMSKKLAACFEKEKFVWGGRWAIRPDAMHFQYCAVR